MLAISAAQLELFERIQFEKMQHKIECAIATAFPESCAVPSAPDDANMPRRANEHGKDVVARGIASGVEIGIVECCDLAAFIALGIALSEGLSGPPDWMTKVLRHANATGVMKLLIIETQLAQRSLRVPALKVVSERVRCARQGAAL